MKLYKDLKVASKVRQEVRALKVSVRTNVLPSELMDFPYLEELYLDGNCTSFPEDGLNWNNLRVLSIKWPQFSGDLSAVFNLSKLENLKIIETPLRTFILPLGHAASPLKSLTIKDCGLEGLPEEISILSHLTDMNLSGNHLAQLPYSLIDLKNLGRLNLDANKFELFPDVIKKIPKLSHLSIDQNLFTDEEKARIQREFHIWPN